MYTRTLNSLQYSNTNSLYILNKIMVKHVQFVSFVNLAHRDISRFSIVLLTRDVTAAGCPPMGGREREHFCGCSIYALSEE